MDDIDRDILDLLRSNGRMPASEIARRVGLSPAPVSRRIERLEETGVIEGYVALINDVSTGDLEEFTEIRLAGGTDSAELAALARQLPEVQQSFMIAGDPDGLLHFRVRNVDHLQTVVNAIRRTGIVSGTKTLIVMSTWDRAANAPTRRTASSVVQRSAARRLGHQCSPRP